MKALWLQWAARIDALSLRERAMVGVAAVAAVIFIVYMGFTDPANARERTLRGQVTQLRLQAGGIDAEVAQKLAEAQADPDGAKRKRLAEVQAESAQLRAGLRTAQRGLVQPVRMSALLQQMVQQNGRLKLVSLKTLAPLGTTDGNFVDPADPSGAATNTVTGSTTTTTVVSPLGTLSSGAPAAFPPAGSAAGTAAPEQPLLYRHGVQIVLRGAYADMVAYMAALERMPAQVYWGKAVLDAAEHDKSTLTLTLYTLGLDDKWIAL